MTKKALLALADGTLFYGKSIGYQGQACAEVVFNTAMTGYQEILTDPSYAEQMVLLTYPHIGNTGTNHQDIESDRTHAKGLIIRDLPRHSSNWRNQQDLSDYLQAHRIVGISDIDTRQLTKKLVHGGAQNACLQAGDIDPDAAVKAAQAHPSLSGRDLAINVTCSKAHAWTLGCIDLDAAGEQSVSSTDDNQPHVVVVDFGVKQMMLRLLVDRGCRLTVVPAQTRFDDIMALQPDGVLLSNGPGDPAACTYAIEMSKKLIDTEVPVLGICLGFQILALAAGATTFKMDFGHHGANHPVQDCRTGRVFITSQNHGFAVSDASMGSGGMEITHRSLFDNTVQGIKHREKAILGFQGHPEASPGPHDLLMIFDQFYANVIATFKPAENITHA